MRFRILVTAGSEVSFAGHSPADRPAYYGAKPETGLWRVSIPKFEDFIKGELASLSFGTSIEEYVFGLEMAELDQWGYWFKATTDYTSYRPKMKSFISAGQIEWRQVKDMPGSKQLSALGAALVSSIERVATAKRKPKDFNHAVFKEAVRRSLAKCKISMVIA